MSEPFRPSAGSNEPDHYRSLPVDERSRGGFRDPDAAHRCPQCGAEYTSAYVDPRCIDCGGALISRNSGPSVNYGPPDADEVRDDADSEPRSTAQPCEAAVPTTPGERPDDPWWWTLGRARPENSDECPSCGSLPKSARPQAYDLFCPEHEELLVFQASRGSRRRWIAANVVRVGAVMAFVLAAQWETPLPLAAGLVLVGGALLGFPLRNSGRTLRVALTLWLLITGSFILASQVDVAEATRRIALTSVFGGAAALWLLYAGVGAGRAVHGPRQDESQRLPSAAIAASLAAAPVALSTWWVLSRGPSGSFVRAPAFLTGYLFGSAVGTVFGIAVIAGLAGLLRSFRVIEREVAPLLQEPAPPSLLPRPARPERPRLVGLRPLEHVGVVAQALAERVAYVVFARLRNVRNFLVRAGHSVRHLVVRLVNRLHASSVRSRRRLRATLAYAGALVASGSAAAFELARRYTRGAALPIGSMAAATVALLVTADATTRYLGDGPLMEVPLCVVSVGALVAAVFVAWCAWSGAPLSAAGASQARTLAVVTPDAFVLFVAAAWGVGIFGTLGFGPIRIGEVTLVSTAVLLAVSVSVTNQARGARSEAPVDPVVSAVAVHTAKPVVTRVLEPGVGTDTAAIPPFGAPARGLWTGHQSDRWTAE